MSLWDKWEREKLEKMGIKVERKDGIKIQDTRTKSNFRKQFLTITLAIAATVSVMFLGWAIHDRFGGHWSDFPLIRSLAGTIERRLDEGRTFR
jgi:hypothetical protein